VTQCARSAREAEKVEGHSAGGAQRHTGPTWQAAGGQYVYHPSVYRPETWLWFWLLYISGADLDS
jgi:hypothetical protein